MQTQAGSGVGDAQARQLRVAHPGDDPFHTPSPLPSPLPSRLSSAYRNIYDIETLPGDTSGARVVARTAGAGELRCGCRLPRSARPDAPLPSHVPCCVNLLRARLLLTPTIPAQRAQAWASPSAALALELHSSRAPRRSPCRPRPRLMRWTAALLAPACRSIRRHVPSSLGNLSPCRPCRCAPPTHPFTHTHPSPQNTTNPYVPVFKYTSCEPCKAGTTCTTTSGVATSCPAGKYTPLLGAQECWDCGDGTVSNGGANACQECLPGTTPVPDKSTCDLCPGGTCSTLPGATCQACLAGTFRDADGGDGTECTKCPPGTFSPGPGATNCTECPAGTVATGEGSTSCTPWCAVGQAIGMPASRRDLQAAAHPSPCSSPLLLAAHFLLMLPARLSSPSSPAGTYSAVKGGQACDPCEPGTYNNQTSQTSCTDCGAGFFTAPPSDNPDLGATSCTACPKGTYKPSNATDNKCQRWAAVGEAEAGVRL